MPTGDPCPHCYAIGGHKTWCVSYGAVYGESHCNHGAEVVCLSAALARAEKQHNALKARIDALTSYETVERVAQIDHDAFADSEPASLGIPYWCELTQAERNRNLDRVALVLRVVAVALNILMDQEPVGGEKVCTERTLPSRRKCPYCFHDAHYGKCVGRNGGTGYVCPCIHDKLPDATANKELKP